MRPDRYTQRLPHAPSGILRLAGALVILLLVVVSCAPPASPTLVAAPTPAPVQSPIPALQSPTAGALVSVPSDMALARQFDAARAMSHIQVLASPEYGGRRAGSPGAEKAAAYLAGEFQKLGLQPAGDQGGYLQSLPIPYLDLAEMPQLALLDAGGAVIKSFQARKQFRELVSNNAGSGRAEGELVFVGPGEVADYRGLDVKGKIVLTTSSQATQAAGVAANQGATGLVIITQDPSRLRMRGSYILPLRSPAVPTLLTDATVVDEMLQGTGRTLRDLENKPSAPLGVRVRLSVVLQPVADRQTANVLGTIPGNDPALKDKVVILGAHYDHLGTDPDGTLFPGANDDASGVAALLEIARLMQANNYRPKATILFAAWTGEEAGLVGASYYAYHPRFPLRDTLGMLQLDVVGQGKGTTLDVTRSRGNLSSLVHAAAGELGIKTSVDPDEGGSDHAVFLQAGVPAVMLIWSDIMSIIHSPDDTVANLDPVKLQATGIVAALSLMRAAEGK